MSKTVTVECSCCTCPVPPPYETTVTDRITGASSHSGSVYSIEYPDCVMGYVTHTPRCSVVGAGARDGLDDTGTIGGVTFDNQEVTENEDGGYTCSGLSTIPSPTEVEVVIEGNKLRVDWSTINSPYCGLGTDGPTGLRAVKFTFYWE
jgi:hypothetical protein